MNVFEVLIFGASINIILVVVLGLNNNGNGLVPGYKTNYGYGLRSGSEPGCNRYRLINGRAKYRQRQRFVRFLCNPGFQLMGDKYATCTRGHWDLDSVPVCVKNTCRALNKTELNNLLIFPTMGGAVLNFYCKQGYTLNGNNQVYCNGTHWQNGIPRCFVSHTTPPLSCNFESEDICGWQHDLNHDFDWRRMNYNTPSGTIGTGPEYDHTKGAGEGGYYMYIESSSRRENDTARLISPFYQKTATDTCFEFYYHMYGATTGTLRVYLKKMNESWNLLESKMIFDLKGNQGSHWFRSLHFLGPIEQDYQIIIEGIRGRSYISDIAIDDVKIIENCQREEIVSTSTTEISYGTETVRVESCENHCGMVSSNNEYDIISCDCDENCLDNNRCCPDYIDHCLMETTTEEYTTTDMSNEVHFTTEIIPKSTKKPPQNSSVTYRKTTTTTIPPLPKSVPKKPIFIVDEPTPKIIEHTQPAPAKTTPPTTKMTVKSKPTTTTTKITPSTAKKFIKTTTKTKKPVTTKKVIKPFIPQVKKIKETDYSYVPERGNDVFDKYDYVEEMGTKVKGTFNHFTEKKTLQVEKPQTHSNTVLIVASVALCSFVLVILLAVGKKYGWYNCGDRRKLGNSQSDVRFLTNDEILDFSCGYDDL
ncbi:unnamed protein product [Brassicogethes aeneus]|uniref:Uncharacterized protein n=1 Tax=Brassicogethes aeneus TaxID=1431903 RepID=A0A9P0FB73_BRAAE|nr:unnamed protein product [Brassicogethes aeneus]